MKCSKEESIKRAKSIIHYYLKPELKSKSDLTKEEQLEQKTIESYKLANKLEFLQNQLSLNLSDEEFTKLITTIEKDLKTKIFEQK